MIKEDVQSKIEFFTDRVKNNIGGLYTYYEHNFIHFCELRSLIWGNINCLLFGLYQASIFTTNHLLERMLKHALFNFHTQGYYLAILNSTKR